MKTRNSDVKLSFLLAMIFSAIPAFAQSLRVDSVTVDSVWNSDSSWYDGLGILQQRYSRDLYLSFTPAGGGTAQCFIALSTDSAITWSPSPDPLRVLEGGIIALPINCDTMLRIKLRVLGQDRPNVAFKVTARQWKPVISGNQKSVFVGGVFSVPTAGAACGVNVGCKLDSVERGTAPVSKLWWDAFGDGIWDDSTTVLSWLWQTTIPQGVSGQRKIVILKARDANSLWSAPETVTVKFGLQKLPTIVPISIGTFQMGSTVSLRGQEQPVHSVTVSAFNLFSTEVTQEFYEAVMDTNPSEFDTGTLAPLRPVEKVSWYDAALFCNKLSKHDGRDTVYVYSGTIGSDVVIDYSKDGYRLPTEAEWEYACRAGSTTDYYWGGSYPLTTTTDTAAMDSNAVWTHNADTSLGWYREAIVGSKTPNNWGLYDMAGNVFEWCNDWFGTYSAGAQSDPIGPAIGSQRILRGGSNASHSVFLCSAARFSVTPSSGFGGFRCVRR